MTNGKLMTVVDLAVELDREISEKQARLKELKEMLVTEAESRDDEHQGTDGGGWSVVFNGNDGCIARVTQPAPTLKSSVDPEKPPGAKLLQLVGKFKDQLFTPVLRYAPVDNYRERVNDLFKDRVAKQIVAMCESSSAMKVSFETKKLAEVN